MLSMCRVQNETLKNDDSIEVHVELFVVVFLTLIVQNTGSRCKSDKLSFY